MSSLLEQARERAAARRARRVSIDLPDLEMELICDVPTDGTEVARMQDAAKRADKGRASGVHFARALVANQVQEIRIGGLPLEVDGQPVCFRDLELQRELKVPDAKSAVVALIGSDGDIANVMLTLMEAGNLSTENTLEADPI